MPTLLQFLTDSKAIDNWISLAQWLLGLLA